MSKTDATCVFAVKQVMRSGVEHCKACKLFIVECTVLENVEHPNLAWRQQIFQSSDCLSLVMEYCKGKSLFDYLCETGIIYRRRTYLRLARQVASGLQCLHERGIVHRDIKPENILFASDKNLNEVKIIDFGIARVMGPAEKLFTQVGTLAYCAPEMLYGGYHAKIDVWALGCTVFLCCSGCLPIFSKHDFETVNLIRDGRITWFMVRALDPDALGLIKSCLETDPQARTSAKAICDLPWLAKAAAASMGCCLDFLG